MPSVYISNGVNRSKVHMYICLVCNCVQKLQWLPYFFQKYYLNSLSFPRPLSFSRITNVCLSSPYFGLWSVDVHEQQFRLFPLVFCKWYFYKQIHFQNNHGIVLLYPYIQTRLQQAGSEPSLIKTKHHEKD